MKTVSLTCDYCKTEIKPVQQNNYPYSTQNLYGYVSIKLLKEEVSLSDHLIYPGSERRDVKHFHNSCAKEFRIKLNDISGAAPKDV